MFMYTFFLVWFQNETSLCRRFTAYVLKYNLMAKENLIVPMDEAPLPPPPPPPQEKIEDSASSEDSEA